MASSRVYLELSRYWDNSGLLRFGYGTIRRLGELGIPQLKPWTTLVRDKRSQLVNIKVQQRIA